VLVGSALLLARPALGVQDATAPVEKLHDALLSAAAEGDTARARYAHLFPVVSDVFDFQAMSRAAVGRVWSKYSTDERAALIEHFAAYATANYAENFDDASNISFRTVGVEPGYGKQVHVETELVRVEKRPISFDYLVFRGAEGPHIINVVVAGTMNELARRRSEFRSLLDAGGLPHLLETLEQQKRALVG
jgi:phospholipid transport system substrate-binding protein